MSENIIQLNEAAIKGELRDLVKNSVEETLNALLEHEADELVRLCQELCAHFFRAKIACADMLVYV